MSDIVNLLTTADIKESLLYDMYLHAICFLMRLLSLFKRAINMDLTSD